MSRRIPLGYELNLGGLSGRELNVVVLGAGGVGKSCLTAQFVHNEWIDSYDPTIEDTYRAHIQVDGRQIVLEILDTAGTEQFVAMRDLYMKSGQGFVLAFSITSAASFGEVASLREEILRIKDEDCVPMVMVGNKCDLEDQRAIPRARAFSTSQEWAIPYYEASARTRTNVEETFIDLCRQMLRKVDELEGWDNQAEGYRIENLTKAHRRRISRRRNADSKCVML